MRVVGKPGFPLPLGGAGTGPGGRQRGGRGGRDGPVRAPGHGRAQAGPRAKRTFCIKYKTRDLNHRPFRRQTTTIIARPQTAACVFEGVFKSLEEYLPSCIQWGRRLLHMGEQ